MHVSWLIDRRLLQTFPISQWHLLTMQLTPNLQWRDRSGFSPDSILVQRIIILQKHNGYLITLILYFLPSTESTLAMPEY